MRKIFMQARRKMAVVMAALILCSVLAMGGVNAEGENMESNLFELVLAGQIGDNELAYPVEVMFEKPVGADTTVYIRAEDSALPTRTAEVQLIVKSGEVSGKTEMNLFILEPGKIKFRASTDKEYKNPVRSIVSKSADTKTIQDIYNEVKTPYEYGVILRPSGIEGDFDSHLVDNPNVFRDGDWWYMTYVGHDKKGYRTGIARSKDLLNWEKLGMVLDNGGQEGTFDRYNAAGYIVRDHVWGEAPKAHQKDGKFVMSYLASDKPGYEEGTTKMGMAYASDYLKLWEKEPKNPVLIPQDWDNEKDKIWKSQVIWDGKRYVAFYNAGWGPEKMCMAYSDDLVNWTREERNPVLNYTEDAEGRPWGSTHSSDADVVKIADQWVMFYFTDTPVGIVDSFAVSEDMVNWRKSYIPLRTKNESFNSDCAHKPCVIKYKGVVYHFYCAVGKEGRVIALATSKEDVKTVIEQQLKEEEAAKQQEAQQTESEANKDQETAKEKPQSEGQAENKVKTEKNQDEKNSSTVLVPVIVGLAAVMLGILGFRFMNVKKQR